MHFWTFFAKQDAQQYPKVSSKLCKFTKAEEEEMSGIGIGIFNMTPLKNKSVCTRAKLKDKTQLKEKTQASGGFFLA